MSTVTLAHYLFTRLRQLGCKSLHGLPGDFNLVLLDYVEPAGISWVGNCNELNAGYAADAYARLNGIGAICTTFGVGELSATNAIAGSYAELAPVVHVVGVPSTTSQAQGMLLHHTLGNGDFTVFARIAKEVTISQADLRDPSTAPAMIDKVLRACVVESRPVYIQVPTDMVVVPVDGAALKYSIDVTPPQSDAAAESLAVQIVLDKMYAAKAPVFLIDGGCQRRRITCAVNALLAKAQLPVFVAPMGKGVVDEAMPFFVGLYAGVGSQSHVAEALESSDLVITIGNIQSDLNTAGFTYHFSKLTRIDIHYDRVDIGYATFQKVYFASLIPFLERQLDCGKLNKATDLQNWQPRNATEVEATEIITHQYLWPRMSSFLRSGDVVITETGTSYVGYWDTRLPSDVTIVNQILWSSIGYGVGASQGAALAMKDLQKAGRTICFEGDGSFQLTAQELSTVIRHDLNVIMFLIENEGYEIERWVHGMNATYNDIPQWKYVEVPRVFTPEASHHNVKTWRVRSRTELEALLSDKAFTDGSGLRASASKSGDVGSADLLQFVEMHMQRGDAPKTLKEFGVGAAKRSS